MSYWEVKSGNTSIQDIEIKDKDGNKVENLDAAESITFKVKKKKTDTTAKITKTKGDGIEILEDDDLGKLRITILPSDTADLETGLYYMGLEIKWNDNLIYEIILSFDGSPTEIFRILQDIV